MTLNHTNGCSEALPKTCLKGIPSILGNTFLNGGSLRKQITYVSETDRKLTYYSRQTALVFTDGHTPDLLTCKWHKRCRLFLTVITVTLAASLLN